MSENVHILELASFQAPELEEVRNEEYILWGEDHSYFDWVIDRYHNSPTNNSVINNVSRLIYGRGIAALDASRKPSEYAQMMALFTPDTLRKITREIKMLGQTSLQVIYNKKHTKIERVEYIPVKQLAAEKCNDEGKIEAYYYSDNWEDVKKYPPMRVPAFGTSKEEIEILYIQPFQVGLKYYSTVDYEGCLPYCVLEEEIATYLNTLVSNNFSARKVINFNNGTKSKEEERIIATKVKNKLTGPSGDGIIVAFNNNVENKTTIDDIPLDDAPEHYSYISTEAQQKILNCHNVTSPMIVGVVTENNGFSSNADEIEVAAKYFYNIGVKPFQDLIIEAMNEILAFNGVNLDLYFKRLNLLDSVEEKDQQQEALTKEVKFESHLQGYLEGIGEDESDEWELIDSRAVDYDLEEDLNSQVKEWEEKLKPKKTGLSKLWELVGTGRANPNAPSEQDQEVDGFYFKVRYKYVGNEAPQRPFCRAMMRANKIYKKEDIENMNSLTLNKGFGHKPDGGAEEAYSIWLYKGGPQCHHKWERRTYVSTRKNASIGARNSTQVSTNKAEQFGYRVRNEKEVAMMPKDMPRNGHHPNFK